MIVGECVDNSFAVAGSVRYSVVSATFIRLDAQGPRSLTGRWSQVGGSPALRSERVGQLNRTVLAENLIAMPGIDADVGTTPSCPGEFAPGLPAYE